MISPQTIFVNSNGLHEGTVVVDNDYFDLAGMIHGDVYLKNDSTFIVRGMVVGNVHVDATSRMFVAGTVKGTIFNKGDVEITGVLDGEMMNIASTVTSSQPDKG